VDTPEGGQPRPVIAPWELDLIMAFVAKVKAPASEREELQAELARKWLIQRIRKPAGIRNLKAYLKGFLRHKIADWHRERGIERQQQVSLDSPAWVEADQPLTLEGILEFFEPDHDLQLDVRNFLQMLDSRLRSVLAVLIEQKGNQSQAARRLGCHRNTIGAMLRKIRELARHRGFRIPRAFTARAAGRPSILRRESPRLVTVDAQIIERLEVHANGASWRVLLWVVSETARRKKRTVPYSWYRIAEEICLDRGDTHRAGMQLAKSGLITIGNGCIGLGRPAFPASRQAKWVSR